MNKKALYNVVQQIEVEGKVITAGSSIELDDVQAEYPLAQGAIALAPVAPSPAPAAAKPAIKD